MPVVRAARGQARSRVRPIDVAAVLDHEPELADAPSEDRPASRDLLRRCLQKMPTPPADMASSRATLQLVAERRAAPGAPDPRRLAVLPLVNLSRDREQDYFVDGMTER